MKPGSVAFLICAALSGPAAEAQTRSELPNPLSTVLRRQFEGVLQLVVRAAEKMPEAEYGFKPTPDVRSFGQLVGHVAASNFLMCSAALGESEPQFAVDLRAATTSKPDLQRALTAAVEYCQRAYAFTDDQLADVVPERRVGVRMQPLVFNAGHNYEHYGNMVTYMRLKGLVPPSSERPEIEQQLQQGQPNR